VAGILGVDAHQAGAVQQEGVGKSSGAFYATCTLSRRAPLDPIVFPGKMAASHMHDFFGPRITGRSTPGSLRRSRRTTCLRPNSAQPHADRSGYWVPTLYIGGKAVRPRISTATYTTGFRALARLRAYPRDLRIVAGDPKAHLLPEPPRPGSHWRFECADGVCTLGVRFPDCWDGRRRDSPDHKSHMAYSSQAAQGRPETACPATHPVHVPRLEFLVKYDLPNLDDAAFSSGPLVTAHADFLNGWDPQVLRALVRSCLRIDRYCGGGDQPVPGHP
jgi:hypothetical protein